VRAILGFERNDAGYPYAQTKGPVMAILLALLVVALLFGLGFAVKVLWLVAIVALAAWLLGFFVAGAESRWYHW
jgi:energy-coupling factor transporter transmembrane protein EcfT